MPSIAVKPAQSNIASQPLHDTYGRTIDYLRISVTDRCNLRCVYCMPEKGIPMLNHRDILTLEEIEQIVAVAAQLGIKHIRLTGGEPLVRKGICSLIQAIKNIPGIESVALTTNGILLPAMAKDLKKAGLDRVNISLDSLDAAQYHAITRRGTLSNVLDGIETALTFGFDPVKINVVVVRHLQQNLLDFAKLTIDKPLHVRFIEYMPVGNAHAELEGAPCTAPSATCAAPDLPCVGSNFSCNVPNLTCAPSTENESYSQKDFIPWSKDDVVPVAEIQDLLSNALSKEGWGSLIVSQDSKDPAASIAPTGWGPATYVKIPGSQGSIGFISAISNHFCASCNRLRLTSDGKLRPCLFSDSELDIKQALRTEGKLGIKRILQEALIIKPEGHHQKLGTKRSMSQMGG